MAALKTHLALLDKNGKFYDLACKKNIFLATNNMDGLDYTINKEEATCLNCLNAVKPFVVENKVYDKPVIWSRYLDRSTWDKATKSDIDWHWGKEKKNIFKRLEAGETIQALAQNGQPYIEYKMATTQP